MSSIKNDVDYSHIQTIEGRDKKVTIEPETHQNKELPQNIRLIDLEKEEEEAYREDADSVIKRYKKVWRYLFYKYSIKKTETAGEDKVHMGEAWKMLKDY
jgi:sialic acid synthase SpsE